MSVAPNPVVIASSAADAAAVDVAVTEHAELFGELDARVQKLLRAVADDDARGADQERATLLAWCAAELLPHSRAEEASMYPIARADPRGRLLIDALVAENGVLARLVEAIRTAGTPLALAAEAHALRVVLASHLSTENDLVLPLLAASPDVSLADILAQTADAQTAEMESAEAENAAAASSGQEGTPGAAVEGGPTPARTGSCGCGGHDDAGFPELDATAIPHAIRHATIFGALDAVGAGGGLVLLAPHAPLPLLRQIADRWPGRFEVSYLEEGPEIWKVQFLAA